MPISKRGGSRTSFPVGGSSGPPTPAAVGISVVEIDGSVDLSSYDDNFLTGYVSAGGAIAVNTLPANAPVGSFVTITDTIAGSIREPSNAITITPAVGDVIDGASELPLTGFMPWVVLQKVAAGLWSVNSISPGSFGAMIFQKDTSILEAENSTGNGRMGLVRTDGSNNAIFGLGVLNNSKYRGQNVELNARSTVGGAAGTVTIKLDNYTVGTFNDDTTGSGTYYFSLGAATRLAFNGSASIESVSSDPNGVLDRQRGSLALRVDDSEATLYTKTTASGDDTGWTLIAGGGGGGGGFTIFDSSTDEGDYSSNTDMQGYVGVSYIDASTPAVVLLPDAAPIGATWVIQDTNGNDREYLITTPASQSYISISSLAGHLINGATRAIITQKFGSVILVKDTSTSWKMVERSQTSSSYIAADAVPGPISASVLNWHVDSSAGAVEIAVEFSFLLDGQVITVTDVGGSAGMNNITLTPSGGSVVPAGADVIDTDGAARTYVYDAENAQLVQTANVSSGGGGSGTLPVVSPVTTGGLYYADTHPDGVITAAEGSISIVNWDDDPTDGELYFKSTGSGDTGWLDISGYLHAKISSLVFSWTDVSAATGATANITLGTQTADTHLVPCSLSQAMAVDLQGVPQAGYEIVVKDITNNANTYPITVTCHDSNGGTLRTIDGRNSYVINVNGGFVRLRRSRTNTYYVVAESSQPGVYRIASTTGVTVAGTQQNRTVILVNSSGGAYTVTITVSADVPDGAEIQVIDSGANAGTNNITVAAGGGTTIVGLTVIAVNSNSITYTYDKTANVLRTA